MGMDKKSLAVGMVAALLLVIAVKKWGPQVAKDTLGKVGL